MKNKFIPSIVIAFILGLVALFGFVTWHKNTPKSLNHGNCSDLFKESESEFKADYITVPLDWDQPEGETIQVLYHTNLPNDWNQKGIVPVMFFNGGPGVPSYDGAGLIFANFQNWAQRNHVPGTSVATAFVFMDQRGTGCSGEAPTGTSQADIKRLTHFATRSIVKDAEAIRKKLIKESKWKIFGESFGAKIVYRYLELFPESISRAHAYGFASGSSEDGDRAGILKAKQLYQEYFNEYPDDKGRLKRLVNLTSSKSCVKTIEGEICGKKILDIFKARYLSHRDTSWGFMHEWLVDSDSVLDEQHVKTYLQAFVDANAAIFNAAPLIEVINLYEDPRYYDYRAACKNIASFIDESDRWLPLGCDWNKVVTKFETEYLKSGIEPDPISYNRVADNLKSSNIKLFVYAGAKDAKMPPEAIKKSAEIFGDSAMFTEFSFKGHDGYAITDQIWVDLSQNN